MGMNRKKAIAWLYGEIPELEKAGVLSRETAEQLQAHYGPVTIQSRRSVALMLFSILGAASIGLGIILLLAHNWDALGRPVRTLLSFMPLVAGQVVAGWTLLRRPDSPAWREGSGMFLALAIGACISLISQTYHIEGDTSAFLLTWIVLAGPLVYVLNASAVALLYIAGITCWAGAVQYEGSQALLFWPLAAFLAPHIWRAYKHDPDGPRVRLLSWGLCAALPIATGLVLERSMPGVWIIVYSGLLCTLWLAGRGPFGAVRLNAFRVAGFIGSAALTLILTYEEVWREVGWRHYRYGGGYHAWAAWQDYGLALAALIGVVVLVVQGLKRKDWFAAVPAGLALLAVLGFAASAEDIPANIIMGAFNVYALILGAAILLTGLDRDELLTVNAGMAVLSMLIILRFFDADISFTIRGILFIILGFAFLGVNMALVRRKAVPRVAGHKEALS
jgi:hypothetical protein